MSSIASFSGLASGIQWADMVDQIMYAEEARVLAPVQTRISAQQARSTAWTAFESAISKFRSAALKLQDGSAFDTVKVTGGTSASTGRTLFTATASSAEAVGSYDVEVLRLAKAEKLGSDSFSSATAGLGLAGQFFVNGRSVALDANDTLNSVRDKINAVNSGSSASGVTATILSTSANEHRLILTADNTGSRGIELLDDTAGLLKSTTSGGGPGLGLLSTTQSANVSPTDSTKTESFRFASSSQTLMSALGVSPPPAVTSIRVGGVSITVDFANDTLLTVQNRILSAGGSATMKEEVVAGKSRYRLSVEGGVEVDTGAASQADSQRVMELMGFVRNGAKQAISVGADSLARIDGYSVTRRTNTLSDVIQGVTLNLLATDTDQRSTSVSGTGLSILLDPQTADAGTHAVVLQTTTEDVQTASTDDPDLQVANNPGAPDGSYAVNLTTSTVRSTSTTSPFLSVTSAPTSVPQGTYGVNITQAATTAATTGTVANPGPYAGNVGDYFRIRDEVTRVERDYVIPLAASLDQVVSGLNNMFTSNGMRMEAINSGGRLQIQHLDYGSGEGFRLNTNNSRVNSHYGVVNATYVGLDVAGTINGQAASGAGRSLTSTSGATSNMVVRYTGTATGAVGSVTVADQETVTGGTIGGQSATWDAASSTLTVNSGMGLAGLAVTYTGTATAGPAGNVILSTQSTEVISGATIGGQTAAWDGSTQTIRGANGTQFAGLELSYTGGVTAGKVGDYVVTGEVGSQLTVKRDDQAVVDAAKALAKEYNAVRQFVDTNTASGAPLAFSSALRGAMSSLTNTLFKDIVGAGAEYNRATLVGLSLTKDGTLELDAGRMKEVLATNPNDVRMLFASRGSGSTASLTYEFAGSATQAGTYGVNVTALATKAAFTTGGTLAGGGGTTYAGNHSLSLRDAISGKTAELTDLDGMSMADIATQLNSKFAEQKMRLTATEVGGQLRIEHKDFGSSASFTASGTFDAAQLDFTAGTAVAGTDVQGTINGVTATGRGRMLTSAPASGEATASAGLAVTYTGTTTGAVGDVTYALGLGGMFTRTTDGLVRAGDGLVASQTGALSSSISSLEKRVSDIEHRLELRREALTRQFTAMEAAMSLFQSQSSWLTSQIAGLPKWSKD